MLLLQVRTNVPAELKHLCGKVSLFSLELIIQESKKVMLSLHFIDDCLLQVSIIPKQCGVETYS